MHLINRGLRKYYNIITSACEAYPISKYEVVVNVPMVTTYRSSVIIGIILITNL